ncbi:MAG: GNAT family N-acetyltransferase [Bacteroidales bacterium]|nr:GNAT family N-acetyltransferase [Bacteroidales bacterium]
MKSASTIQEINTDHLTIRKAVIEDAPFVARCVLEAIGFENITDEILARQTAFSRREDVLYSWRHALMAEYEGETVGCIIAYEGRRYPWLRSITFPIIKEMCGADFSGQRDETGPGEYYLDSLYVVPKYRNCGIGTKLMLSGIANARTLRIPRVGLIVSTEKPEAQKLYRSLGFTEKERFIAFNEPFIKMTMELEQPPMLEVCAASFASARTAAKAGATRIELCQRLDLGGLTPDHEVILTCVRELSLQTFVLIRPRGGDFCYSDEEFRTILDDIRFCRDNGVPGVVVGFLNPDNDIDVEKSRAAVEAAGTMQVTFHRAFDRCIDWRKGLEEIIRCGYSRILTSGQQPTAIKGIETLKEIQKQSNGRITILASSGVNSENAAILLRETGVHEVHGSCKISGYESDYDEVVKTLEAIAK